jgi:hypothetical protein
MEEEYGSLMLRITRSQRYKLILWMGIAIALFLIILTSGLKSISRKLRNSPLQSSFSSPPMLHMCKVQYGFPLYPNSRLLTLNLDYDKSVFVIRLFVEAEKSTVWKYFVTRIPQVGHVLAPGTNLTREGAALDDPTYNTAIVAFHPEGDLQVKAAIVIEPISLYDSIYTIYFPYPRK